MRTLKAALLLCTTCTSVGADEGMWLFNSLPEQRLKSDYNFDVNEQWTEHLMLSSVRFNSGGSASFISSNGLVLTNHHVASDTLYKLSTPERNIANDGYLASAFEDELKAPDLELNQLVAIEDVTDQVNGAVAADLTPAEAAKARQAAMAEIEQAAKQESGLRCDVVTLYGGARYHLYSYKRYTDVRLVWAPEAKTAFFGGDADNFEYPRYCLDVTIFRVYENDQPAQIEHFLRPNPDGGMEDDLVFVSGNPGRTQRVLTAEALEYQRDHRMPQVLNLLRRKEILLQQYAFGGPELARRGQDDLFGIQNSRKAYTGMLAGLQQPGFIQQKRSMASQLQKAAGNDHAWTTVAEVQQKRIALKHRLSSLRSSLYSFAEDLVLLAAEDQKPSAERLREYRDSNRQSLEQALFSPAPLYEDLERVQLADELARMIEYRGGNDPLVHAALDGKGPRQRATELVAGTQLLDAEYRRNLAAGGADAIANSQDPLIRLARTLESEYRAVRAITEELDELERQAYSTITEAKFKTEGESVYPDATFTLRLAYGTVKSYEEDGQHIPANTTMGGAFDHEQAHRSEDDWVLPESWNQAKDRLNKTTPFNFVCTADIIGGNSGSPVVDRNGEIVGIIFDGNIQSLTADFYFNDNPGRAVAVHIAAVLEALETIYQAPKLREQIGQ